MLSALLLPRLPARAGAAPASPRNDVLGFLAVLAAVAVGVVAHRPLRAAASPARCSAPLLGGSTLPRRCCRSAGSTCWRCCSGIAFTLPLAAWAARTRALRDAARRPAQLLRQPGAAAFLLFIVLYKLGDAFAGSLMTPFLLQSMAYTPAEVGVVNKVIGLWLTIGGALLGGALMLRLGLWRSLLLFGVLQMASNLGFWWLAVERQGRCCPGS